MSTISNHRIIIPILLGRSDEMKRYEIMLELLLECLILAGQVVVCIYLIPKTLGFLWPFVTGWLIALLTWPLIRYLQGKLNIGKRYLSIFILISLILIIGTIFYLLLMAMGKEAYSFITDLPSMYDKFVMRTKQIPDLLRSVHLLPDNMQMNMDVLIEYIKDMILSVVNQIASVGMDHAGTIASNIANFLIGVVVSILSAYFFVVYKERMHLGYQKILSEELQQRIEEIIYHIKSAIGGYLIAQLKLMGIIFAILSIGLFIAGNPYALFVALLIAIVDVIPFFGTGFILIPWAVFDFISGDYFLMILRLVLYVICLLSRQLLQPKIIGDSVGLDPFLTLLFIYVGFKIDGIRGFLLAMILGIILLNFYKLGLFDKKINRFKHLLSKLKRANDSI